MKLKDFKIGKKFFASAGFEWLCTDKGSRTVTAIMLDPELDSSWFAGPPYAVSEIVFDEHDLDSCYTDQNQELVKTFTELKTSAHPNFRHEDVLKMMREISHDYPRDSLLKTDRVTKNGLVLHPYGAMLKKDGWHIKTFELFSREYSKMHEDSFVQLKYCSEQDLKKRKKNYLG